MHGGRITRWLAHPIRALLVACPLCWLLADAATNARMVGPLALVPFAGLALFALLLVVLVYRTADAIVVRGSVAPLQHALQLSLLLALNLMLLALVLAGIGSAVKLTSPARHADRLFSPFMAAAFRGGTWIGSVAPVVGLIGGLAVAVGYAVRRVPAVAAMGRVFTAGVWSLLVVYALGVTALMAGAAGRWLGTPPTEVVVTVKDVRPVFGPLRLIALTVDSWRTVGTQERFLVIRGADDPAVTRVEPGRRLRIDTRPGLLGVPVIDQVRGDAEGALPELVALLPSAEWPRKQLMTDLTRRARWTELAAHAREYRRHHPTDQATIAGVIATLRQAGQLEPARSLEAELARARAKGRAL
jgi:hypothetical protein